MPQVTLRITTVTEATVHVNREDRRNYGVPGDSWGDIAVAKHDGEGGAEHLVTSTAEAIAVNED